MLKVVQSIPEMIVCTYDDILDEEFYKELERLGIIKDRIKDIERDYLNDKVIINIKR